MLLHGLGSDEQDLIGIADELRLPYTVVSVRAPQAYAMGGFAWFDVTWAESGLGMDAASAQKSRDQLAAFIRDLPQELDVRPKIVVLGGFSQGAMMAFGVAGAFPGIVQGLLLLSGAPLPAFAEPADFRDLPTLVQHGLYDPLLPVAQGRRLAETLGEAGAKVQYREYPMGHEVSLESLQDARSWLLDLATAGAGGT